MALNIVTRNGSIQGHFWQRFQLLKSSCSVQVPLMSMTIVSNIFTNGQMTDGCMGKTFDVAYQDGRTITHYLCLYLYLFIYLLFIHLYLGCCYAPENGGAEFAEWLCPQQTMPLNCSTMPPKTQQPIPVMVRQQPQLSYLNNLISFLFSRLILTDLRSHSLLFFQYLLLS